MTSKRRSFAALAEDSVAYPEHARAKDVALMCVCHDHRLICRNVNDAPSRRPVLRRTRVLRLCHAPNLLATILVQSRGACEAIGFVKKCQRCRHRQLALSVTLVDTRMLRALAFLLLPRHRGPFEFNPSRSPDLHRLLHPPCRVSTSTLSPALRCTRR